MVDAVDLGREAGQDNAALGLVDDVVDGINRRCLRGRAAWQLGVRRIAEHGDHAGIAKRGEALAVDLALDVLAGGIHLVIAGEHDRAEVRRDGDGSGIRNRVRDADELHGDRADLDLLTRRHGLQGWQWQVVLGELGLNHCGRKRQRDHAADRCTRPDQVCKRSDMIVVSVRNQHGIDRATLQGTHVRQVDVDAKAAIVAMRKADAAIDHEADIVVLDDHHIAPDFAETANRRNANRVHHVRHGNAKCGLPAPGDGAEVEFLAYSCPLGVWRSLVARSVRDGEVRSSNLRTPMSSQGRPPEPSRP